MEEHYIKDIGKITYVYGVNLEEHKTVIEKQQKRIAELEKELAEYNKYKQWQEKLSCENADELIDFVMSNLLTEDEKCRTIKELNKELAELKEKMQEEISRREIYFISWLGNKVCKGYVIGYNEEDKFIIICGEDMISTNEIFTYEQEAQAKLQELRGGE